MAGGGTGVGEFIENLNFFLKFFNKEILNFDPLEWGWHFGGGWSRGLVRAQLNGQCWRKCCIKGVHFPFS